MAKGVIGRLLKKAASKGARSTVRNKTTSAPTSTAAKRAAVRTKAKTASNTKVQTAPSSRRIGTKATLNGKDVYWGGKNFGWQSKASLTKITNGKTKPKVTGQAQKPKFSAAPPKKGAAPKGTRDQANNSKTITARGRSAQRLRERTAATRTGKPIPSTRLRTDPDTGRKVATAPGVKNPPGSPKRGTNRPRRLTKAQEQRARLVKNRDIGAKAVDKKTPKTTARTSKEAGSPKPSQRGYSAGQEVKELRADLRKAQTKLLTSRALAKRSPSKQVGNATRTAESAAAGAKASFKRKAETIYKQRLEKINNSTTLTGRQKQKARETLKSEVNKASTRVGRAAKAKSLEDSKRSKLNRSPTSSKQDPKDLKQSNLQRKSSRDLMRESQKLSEDMSRRKASGKLSPVRSMGDAGGKKASTSEGLKTGRSNKDLTSKQKAKTVKAKETDTVGTRTTKDGKRTTLKRESSAATRAKSRANTPAAQKAQRERDLRKAADKTLGKRPTSSLTPSRSKATQNRLRARSKEMTAEMKEFRSLPKAEQQRLMRQSSAAQTGSAKSGEVRLQGGGKGSRYSFGTGSDKGGRFNNAGSHDGTKSRTVSNKGAKKDGRSAGATTQAQQALKIIRERRANRRGTK